MLEKKYVWARVSITITRIIGWIVLGFGILIFITSGFYSLVNLIDGENWRLLGGALEALWSIFNPILYGIFILAGADVIESFLDTADLTLEIKKRGDY